MKQSQTLATTGVLVVLAVLVWRSAEVLLSGPPPAASELPARAISFAVLALSQALFLYALVVLSSRLLRRQRALVRLPAAAIVALLGAVIAPFAAIPFVVGLRALCFNTSLCASEPLQYVPHALYVAASYPGPELLLAAGLLFGVLLLSGGSRVDAVLQPVHEL